MADQQEPIRKLPVRTEEFALDGEYEGWTFTARVSMPMGRYGKLLEDSAPLIGMKKEDKEDLTKKSAEEMGVALRAVVSHLKATVTEWNFVDEIGADLPLDKEESWLDLPMDLINKMFDKVLGRVQESPLVKGKEPDESPTQEGAQTS